MAGKESAVSWSDKQVHLRVYKVDGNHVTEEAFDGSWKKGGFSQQGTTVGATSWVDGGQIHLRVYVGNAGTVKEYCWDKDKWYVGGFSESGEGAAATSWLEGNQIHIRVYVRESATKVVEYGWDKDKWYKGSYPG